MSKIAINEEFLQQLEALQILLKNNLAGLFGGNHKSRTYGSSCEFADYRNYIPGDDISKIDWNAYARFEKLYLKLFLDERQVHTRIYIDASRSMDYGRGEKALMALKIAAALAYLSVCEMDRVSVYYIKNNKVHEVMNNIVGKEAFYNSIGKLNDIEFSDKKRDLFCFQILSKEEIKPNIRGKVHFYDSEDVNKQYRKNINKEIVTAYNEALEYTKNRIKTYCNSRNASYMLVQSDKSVNEIFLKNLPEMGVLK